MQNAFGSTAVINVQDVSSGLASKYKYASFIIRMPKCQLVNIIRAEKQTEVIHLH